MPNSPWKINAIGSGSAGVTVGVGGQYPTILAAVNAIGSRYVERFNDTKVLTATLNSAVVTFVGTTFRSSATKALAVGSLITFGAVNRKYKIKTIDSDTQITLQEVYKGTTITATSTLFTDYYLDRRSIILLPGTHEITRTNASTAAAGIVMVPGVDITGVSARDCVISQTQASMGGVAHAMFEGWSDNTLENVSLGGDPTKYTSAYFCPIATAGDICDYQGGLSVFKNVYSKVFATQYDGNDSPTVLPRLVNGISLYIDCEFNFGQQRLVFSDTGPAVGGAATKANTRVEFYNSRITKTPDFHAVTGSGGAGNSGLTIEAGLTTVIFDSSSIKIADAATAAGDIVSGIAVTDTNVRVDIINSNINVANTGDVPYGVYVDPAAGANSEVNIRNSSVVATGTTPVGVSQKSSGVTTIESSRIEAATTAVERTSGTVNIEKGVNIVGPVSGTLSSTVRGVITLNGATPVVVTTSKVHTNSRIRLSRIAMAGTTAAFGVSAVTNNTSFAVTGTALDTSTVLWELEE